MKKLIILTAWVLGLALPATAQHSLAAVLRAVEDNNPGLASERQYWEAETLRLKVGLTLPNPTVAGEYLIGSPETAGEQIDLSVLQSFELPSAYRKRRELAAVQAGRSVSEVATRRQEVLLEAKLVCLELTYQYQLLQHFAQRRAALTEIEADFRQRLESGEGNILDVNKVGLQLLELQQRQRESELEIQRLQILLTELNGGQPIAYQDTLYPPPPPLAGFDQLEEAAEAADPERITLQQERDIAEKQLEVARLYRLPSFEAGYRYQGILGQRFNGLHAGITLPLWEQKYRTETRQAQVVLADRELARFANAHYYEMRQLYDRQASLGESLDVYRDAIQSVDNTRLLDKALRFGEITTIEYFLETSLYQNARLHYLQLEYEYHATLARLTKYLL